MMKVSGGSTRMASSEWQLKLSDSKVGLMPESTGGLPIVPAEMGTNGLFNNSIVSRSVACDKAMLLLGPRVGTPVEQSKSTEWMHTMT